MTTRVAHKPAFNTEDARFRAVLTRDVRADAGFVYGVITTKVFCRASCASKKPLRKNVRFFASPAEATAAGFRACLRCRPLERDLRAKPLERACRLLESDVRPESREVAAALGLSQAYFQRWFKRELGVTPQAYARRVQKERAKEELQGSRTVLEATTRSGYSATSRFYDGAGPELGMPARSAQKGAKDETVRYAIEACWLGRLLVAFTERGVCHVALGDSDEDVLSELSERFPRAVRVKTRAPGWVREIAQTVRVPGTLKLPLDIRGTAFQEQVWALLRQIPLGETRSYGELAAALSAPQASRAVARACAQNPLAVVVPCHRVVRSDGGLAGYRWGLPRKRALVQCEAERGAELRDRSGV